MTRCIACYQFRERSIKFLLLVSAFLCFTTLFLTLETTAQVSQPVIKGRVLDEGTKPLADVSVILKGSSSGTKTNANGEYSIAIPNAKAVLVFSFVGLQQQEIVVGTRTELNITMLPGVAQQDEVVIVGYGTQKKQAVTGAVVKADLKTYENVTVNNIMETLKGTVAGLNVGEANTAGGVPGVTIRGTNTIAASNSPLIVLDGVIFSGSLADISPSDVESVTVLKDASAAAVYGSRSANGVIIIETKKGTGVNGKPKFELRTSYGSISELKPLEVYGAQGYMQHLNDVLNDNGTVVAMDQTPNYLQTNEKVNYNATPDHKPTLEDPYSLFRQTGYNFNTSLSVSQRTD